MPENKDYETGYKSFETRANHYVNDPQKTSGLLKKAAKKAKDNKSSLAGIWEKFQLLIDMVKSWSNGEYREVSKKSIVFLIASILYFVSPIDLVPDFLIGLGIVDDAAVLTFAIKQVSDELNKYRLWKQSKAIDMEKE